MLAEINFDGLIGPSHNYAGLSLGNLASARNAGGVSHPRAASLQGIEKMRANIRLGLTQGILLPHDRPNGRWLAELGVSIERHDITEAPPSLMANALSASPMWAANAATVSPSPDTRDQRCHLTVANLITMPHRSHEWLGTLAQLRVAFAQPAFEVHGPVPPTFGDEGAANHMRLCYSHGDEGIEIFVYGIGGGAFPARQHIEASRAVARKHGAKCCVFVQQSDEAIAAGAFHNDVVAVANERVLFAHEQAFADKETFYSQLTDRMPEVEIVEVPKQTVSLEDAIRSYLFNAQLVTLPSAEMALIVPTEAIETPSVKSWLESHIEGNGPIRRVIPVDVRQSMANGGGPACLRLRVVCDPVTVDRRFLVDEDRLDLIAEIVAQRWPETIEPSALGNTALHTDIASARAALLTALGLELLI